MQLESFLQSKMEYSPFDPKRAPKILQKLHLKSNDNQIIIQIIGTNGKGSTGRFLSLLLKELGFSVGHFTSPHLLHINERFWRDGKLVSNDELEKAFLSLDKEAIKDASYFEILTFLAKIVFNNCEFLVLEAGLGGEFDSTTTCFSVDLSLFTPIGFDHEAFLGNSIKEIATTKLNAMSKRAILGFQAHSEVLEIAKQIAKKGGAKLEILNEIPTFVESFIKQKQYATFQAQNLTLSLSALNALRELGVNFRDFKAQDLLESLPPLDLQGRMQKIAKNVFCDVLHNISGAKAVLKALQNYNFNENQIIFIYNSYFDKNPKEILKVLRPMIKRVEILDVQNPRIMKKEALEGILRELNITFCDFKEIKSCENYLVCGSFSVVAEFLKQCQ